MSSKSDVVKSLKSACSMEIKLVMNDIAYRINLDGVVIQSSFLMGG
jgi:hypothetical protein